MIRLKLPFPPTVNTMWPPKNGGGRRLSNAGREYRQIVYGESLAQLGIFKPLTGFLKASVELFPPDKRKRDIDNYHKAIFDSLAHANCFMDDSQIKELFTVMREPVAKELAGCVVILEELE